MTTTNTTASDTTTIHIAPSIGTPSTTVDTAGAMDYSVTLTIGDRVVECEVTLVPSQYDGRLGAWGDLDNWLSGPGVAVVRSLGDRGGRELAREIAAACVAGDDSEVEAAA
jgi:hypothetical protein